MTKTKDEKYMLRALKEAKVAFRKNEVPIGCVIVHKEKIIAKAYNQIELLKDSTAHAELIALTIAQNYLSSKYLENCTLYVTVEPCLMCWGALLQTRISRLVYGTENEKYGFSNSISSHKMSKQIEVEHSIFQKECSKLMQDFFRNLRNL